MKKLKNIKTFRKGDILLVKHYLDPVAWLICKKTNSQFNHTAWIISEDKLIEAGRYGVAIHPISKYFNQHLYKFEVVRIKNISQTKLNKAITLAITSTRKGNYFKQILTFILLYLQYKGVLPKSTCSGLIAQALFKVGVKLSHKRPSRVTPEDIYRSKHVRKV